MYLVLKYSVQLQMVWAFLYKAMSVGRQLIGVRISFINVQTTYKVKQNQIQLFSLFLPYWMFEKL